MLWGRAGNRCSHPKCRRELTIDSSIKDRVAVLGEAAHIIGEKPGAARWDPVLSDEERDSYANRILLCGADHKLIDDQENEYSVEVLHSIKAQHEKWVRESLQGFDSAKQLDEEAYAEVIDGWADLANLRKWTAWTSHLLSGGLPKLWIDQDEKLEKLRTFLLNRIWPDRYRELYSALENFRRVLVDFHELFREYAEEHGDRLFTRKFYKDDEWDPDRYNRLSKRFEFHVDLVQDLVLELTRAANHVAERIREYLDPRFRRVEGHLLVEWGPDQHLGWHKRVVAYNATERRAKYPYPGLEKFKTVRQQRDVHFGHGSEPED